MEKIGIKLTVGVFALVFGIAIVWATGVYNVLLPAPSTESTPIETSSQTSAGGERSGKVLVHFKGFEFGKGWVANFEIVNETAHPILYIGSERKGAFDYCTLAVKHEEPFPANHDGKIDNLSIEVRSACYYGTYFGLQSLEPGETVTFAVDEYEVRRLRYISNPKQETVAQIGFEFFVGEERRREILWSEEITFPDDASR